MKLTRKELEEIKNKYQPFASRRMPDYAVQDIHRLLGHIEAIQEDDDNSGIEEEIDALHSAIKEGLGLEPSVKKLYFVSYHYTVDGVNGGNGICGLSIQHGIRSHEEMKKVAKVIEEIVAKKDPSYDGKTIRVTPLIWREFD